MPLFTKVVERFNVIPIKIAMVFFPEREKKNPKIHRESQETLHGQSTVKTLRWNKAGRITLPRLYHVS